MSTKRKIFTVLIVAFVFAAFVRTFFIEGFVVAGDSMEPTISSLEFVIINKLAYSFGREPQRGDIIVVESREMRKRIIKRIIALPGERFAIEEGRVVIREYRLDEGEILEEKYLSSENTPEIGTTLIELDPQEYFALGDNREVSVDSRELGPVDKWDIKGKVVWSFNLQDRTLRSF